MPEMLPLPAAGAVPLAICSEATMPDTAEPTGWLAQTCRKCGAPMADGIALVQTLSPGSPDLGGGDGQTLSAGGPGMVVPVSKCTKCGWSVG